MKQELSYFHVALIVITFMANIMYHNGNMKLILNISSESIWLIFFSSSSFISRQNLEILIAHQMLIFIQFVFFFDIKSSSIWIFNLNNWQNCVYYWIMMAFQVWLSWKQMINFVFHFDVYLTSFKVWIDWR